MDASEAKRMDRPALKLAGEAALVGVERYTFADRFAWMFRVVKSGRLAELKPAAMGLWMVYAAHADERLVAWPGSDTIRAMIACSAESVRRARAELAEAGLIEVLSVGAGRAPTRVRLVDPRNSDPRNSDPRQSAPGQSSDEGEGFGEDTPPDGPPSWVWGQPPRGCGGSPLVGVGGSMTSKCDQRRTSKGDDELPTGLFEGAEAAAALERLGFRGRDARRQVSRYGAGAVLLAVEHVRCVRDGGRTLTNVRGFVVSTLAKVAAGEISVDERAMKRRRAADCEAAEKLERASRVGAGAEPAAAPTADADALAVAARWRGWLEFRGGDVGKARRSLINEMRGEGWSDDRTAAAAAVLESHDQPGLFDCGGER